MPLLDLNPTSDTFVFTLTSALDGIYTRNGGVAVNFANIDFFVTGSGNDTFVWRNFSQTQTIDAGSGTDTFSVDGSVSAWEINLAVELAFVDATTIHLIGFENATGNNSDNTITGNAAANVLIGGGGFDTLRYVSSPSGVTVRLDNNTVSGGHAQGDTISGFEAVVGSNHADNLQAFFGPYTILGGGGNDTIQVGSGVFTVDAGNNDDALIVISGQPANAGSSLAGGLGMDTFRAGFIGTGTMDLRTVSLTGFETLRYQATISGDLQINAAQFAANFTAVTSALAGGNQVISIFMDTAIAFSLAGVGFSDFSGVNDRVVIIGDGDAETITGSSVKDTIFGNGGGDVLIGGGGDDILVGGAGDDTYFAQQAGDVITELPGEGNDLVYVIDVGTFTLSANVEVAAAFGTTLNLIGNSDGNTLIGNALNNVLNGGGGDDLIFGVAGGNSLIGGAGNDSLVSGTGIEGMSGGANDDTYIIGPGDIVTENAGEGTDTVWSPLASYTLTDHVEIGVVNGGTTLIGTNVANTLIGDGNFNVLSGLGGSDFLVGGGGGDILIGGGGLDTMQGSTGGDVFWWTAISDLGDIIQDWINTEDQLQFTAGAFFNVAGAVLVNGVNFIASTNPFATTANATFLWDTDDTNLFFDPDGNGAAGRILVADLQAFTTLTVSDFQFV